MAKMGYVQMPQDDMAQIEQIVREYCSEPAKGLAHGTQKDALQNGFGARAVTNEKVACRTWRFYFELHKVNGSDALSFWDEGTLGLTGELLTAEQIMDRIAADTLGPDQRLGRFLARLVSGGNLGPGIFGRGKLIFHGASTTTSILVDSRRSDDSMYIALDRGIISNRLMQPEIPFCGEEAERFIAKETGGALKPLENTGTRVTILDLDPEVADAFKLSFSPSPTAYRTSFAHMIEETWWEIIHKFGARIVLKYGGKTLQVGVHEPLQTIITAEDGQDGVRIHERENIPITAGGNRYRIKQLRLVVLPKPLDDEYREVWIQRKRMRIGRIYRYIDAHPKISQRLTGYIILEPKLEDLVEEAESPTHYGFILTKAGIKQIRQVLQAELKEFEKKLGLVPVSEDTASQKRLLDSMREISEYAPELGLMTLESVGIKRSDAEIIVRDLRLPNAGTLRVEFGDKIGPINYGLLSTASTSLIGVFRVEAKQYGRAPLQLYERRHNLGPNESADISVPKFDVTRDQFEAGKPLDIAAVYFDSDTGRMFASLTRRLYLGMQPPEPPRSPVQLSVTCRLPRKNTRRVEISDVIRNIKIKATNTTPFDLKVHLTSSVRHLENRRTGRPTAPLFTLFEEKSVMLKGQADHIVYIDDISVTLDKFSSVRDAIASTHERACDIFTTVRLVEDSPDLGLPRRWTLDKVSIPFYLEVDPPGFNIFQDCRQLDDPADGRPSWYDGSAESGYTFYLNVGHYSYRFIQNRGDEAVCSWYEKEQMLRQAYLIAFENEVYKGPVAEFKDKLAASDLPFREAVSIYDHIVGSALNAIGRR
ncbi:hypothetical protein ES703_02477 [subsurface metagenome]